MVLISRGAALCIFAMVMAAICINFSGVQQYQNADALLEVLISIENPTAYYWGDNRYGMLVPWLTSFIRDYNWNLFTQTQIAISCVFFTIIVFRGFFHRQEGGINAQSLASSCITFMLGLAIFRPSATVPSIFFLLHPYFVALSLSLPAVVLLTRPTKIKPAKFAIAAILLLLCFWVMWPMVAIVVVLIGLLPDGSRNPVSTLRRRIPALLIAFGAFGLMYWNASRYPPIFVTGLAPSDKWWNTAVHMAASAAGDMLFVDRFGAVAALSLLVLWLTAKPASLAHFKKGLLKGIWSPGGATVAASFTFMFATVTSMWVIYNAFSWRYWTVPIALLFLVASAPVSDWIVNRAERLLGSELPVAALCSLLLLTASIRAFGAPSVAHAMATIDKVTGRDYPTIRSLGCTHLIGNYWMSWGSVFFNRTHRRDPREPKLWAIALRAEAQRDRWSEMPDKERKYCGICGDWEIEAFRKTFDLEPLHQTGSASGPASQPPSQICRFAH